MKKKIDLSNISDEEMYAELGKRHKKKEESALRGCVVKCWHCGKGSNLKRWFHIVRQWFEDNVYTSHYNSDDDHPEIVCPNCNRINRAKKEWTYDTLKPREDDLNELKLYQVIEKFHGNGGSFAKYYERYGAIHYGGKDEYYELKRRYAMRGDEDCVKVEVNFR